MENGKPRLLGANKYLLTVSFDNAGLVISDLPTEDTQRFTQRQIVFTEICNYSNTRFPGRTLEVTMNFDEIDKLFASRSSIDDNSMFDVDILCSPTNGEDGVSHLLPFTPGRYKALMKTNETVNSYLTTRDMNTITEQNMDLSTVVQFILFMEPELSFSLNPNINFLYTGNNLYSIFAHMCSKAIPGIKMVISKMDHNPDIPKFLIPRMDLGDAIELLNDEFGFYKSGYNMFVENDIMYFLNKEEEPNVTVDSLDYEILLDVNRFTGLDNSTSYKQNIESERSMITKINVDKIKIFVNNKNVLKNDPIYISPSGKTTMNKNSSARGANVVRKITEVPHLESYSNIQYETIELDLDDVSFINVNNLTKIIYIDSTASIRKYRVNFKYTKVISNESTITKLQAFRIINKS